MTTPQITVALLLAGLLLLFVWGRFRHDVVALLGLLAAVLLGLVPAEAAFAGFANPAVITVAFVLVLSKLLADTGAVDIFAKPVMRATATPSLHVAALGGTGGFLSAFMNNIGALGLLLPIAMQTAASAKRSPAILLMPLAFASILGGMVTLIGTPPNLLVSTIRHERLGEGFNMFDFTPVGLPVALAGLAFVALIGWRLVPKERRSAVSAEEFFKIADYLVELKVAEDSKLVGRSLQELAGELAEAEAMVLSLERGGRRWPTAPRRLDLQAGDLLLVEVPPDEIDRLAATFKLVPTAKEEEERVEEAKERRAARARANGDQDGGEARARTEDVRVVEAVVKPGGMLVGRSIGSLYLADRYGVVVLGVAREGESARRRVARMTLAPGDVLLLRGEAENLAQAIRALGLLPLAERGVQVGRRAHGLPALAIFAAAIVLTATGLLSTPVALGLAVVTAAVAGLLPVRELYDGVDWPVVVLLAALIPVGGALETTGLAGLVAGGIGGLAGELPVWALLAIVLVVTMTLSDVLNNAATVVVMAPIALGVAEIVGASPDAFLMAVAIGGSAAFLTPIGHQNNTLVMGPGGYLFADYWRMGLPLEILITVVAVPLLMLVWG